MEKDTKKVSEECKSMKQARLPFKVLDIKSTFLLSGQQRKRKLSDGEDACKTSKSPRPHNENNVVVIDLCSPKREEDGEIENVPEIVSSPVKCYLLDNYMLKSPSNSRHKSVKAGEIPVKSSKLETRSYCSSSHSSDLNLKKNSNQSSGEQASYNSKNNDNGQVETNSLSVDKLEDDEIKSISDSLSVVSSDEHCQNITDSEKEKMNNSEAFSSQIESCSDVEKMDISGSSQRLSLSDLDKVISDESFKIEIAEQCQMGLKSEPSANCSFEGSSLSSLNCSTPSADCSTPKVNKSIEVDSATKPRRKKKMSEAEAKQKSLLRLERQKEKDAIKLKRLEEKDKLKRLKQENKEKLQLEKKKEKLEAKNKREQEKKEKREEEERRKEEKLRQKQERKELLEKERLEKIKEKEEKRQQKQQLFIMKSEEKKKKEEDKLKKLEEKKKAEEEEERKREKEKAVFASFFVKTDPPTQIEVDYCEGLFRPFQVTKDMTLAPIVPAVSLSRFSADIMDSLIAYQDLGVLYLEALKRGEYVPFRRKKKAEIKGKDSKNDAIIIVDSSTEKELTKRLHPKLLQFCENVRPPYWGTWRKRSRTIRSRRPFACDETFFDYDVDSDEEWDEGGPGESLSATEDEKESEDDYEVDNEFFVPHGYLSSDEEHDDEGNISHSPESQHERLKMRAREFEAERNQKCSQLHPNITGCVWDSDPSGQDERRSLLSEYSAVLITTAPIMTSYTLSELKTGEGINCASPSNPAGDGSVQRQQGFPKRPVPEEAMPYLIELVHGNTNGRHAVVREFQEFWRQHWRKRLQEDPANKGTPSDDLGSKTATGVTEQTSEPRTPKDNSLISKRQLEMTVQKISVWCKSPSPAVNKCCWWVHEGVREKYGCTSLPLPNKHISRKEPENPSPLTPVMGTPSIKKFVKKIVPIRLSGSSKVQCVLPFNDQTPSNTKEDIAENLLDPNVTSKSE